MLAVEEAVPGDGASAALGASSPVRGDQALTALLAEAAGAATGAVVSSDLFYDPRPGWAEARAAEGCGALDLESAAVLQAATLGGVRAACLLGMVATSSGRERLDREAAGALVLRAGQAAWAALLEG
jgi:uridine phosphorylase